MTACTGSNLFQHWLLVCCGWIQSLTVLGRSYLERWDALLWILVSCLWEWSRHRALHRGRRHFGSWCCTPWLLCFPSGWREGPKTTSHFLQIEWWCDWATPLVILCCPHCIWKGKKRQKIQKKEHIRDSGLQHNALSLLHESSNNNTTQRIFKNSGIVTSSYVWWVLWKRKRKKKLIKKAQ